MTYYVATSLDGRIADPEGGFDAFPMEGDHMQVLMHEYTDTIPTHLLQRFGLTATRSRFDTVLMGWETYTPALKEGIDSPYQHLRQVIASRQEREVPDGLEVTADPVRRLRELKAEPGQGIWVAGGGRLAGSVLDEIDRLVLKINPIVLGAGIPLFGGIEYSPRTFTRVGWRAFESGTVIAEYERAGAGS
ncbi:dihydrofolate reductase family protein [Kineosporia rhizophila]|uniref:dihydrofolate reductase family protein n=1 Tax=Kineosporia TaxID=49184 RepID=UPI001E61C55B|nr:dihydrofolate reductase family protein [Kineosporia sp. NBRC 101677]MCE0537511.1 dihydrofolate reductase family protein [Kineosporia rhizophila]